MWRVVCSTLTTFSGNIQNICSQYIITSCRFSIYINLQVDREQGQLKVIVK